MDSRDEDALRALRASLLRRPRPQLRSDQGDEAFDQHMLLAAGVHRAACLYRCGNNGKIWGKYVTSFFPEGRNAPEDAELLWKGWRTSLLKNEKPIVPIRHGQPHLHWTRENGLPVLNLEDAWDDYQYSVDQFIEHLRADPDDRANCTQTVAGAILDSVPAPTRRRARLWRRSRNARGERRAASPDPAEPLSGAFTRVPAHGAAGAVSAGVLV